MFFPEGQIRVWLYGQPCDLRKSFNGLQALVRQQLHCDPLDGSLYVFNSRHSLRYDVGMSKATTTTLPNEAETNSLTAAQWLEVVRSQVTRIETLEHRLAWFERRLD